MIVSIKAPLKNYYNSCVIVGLPLSKKEIEEGVRKIFLSPPFFSKYEAEYLCVIGLLFVLSLNQAQVLGLLGCKIT